MAFELYGLLPEGGPEVTLDTLASDLTRFFAGTERFHLEPEDDPFDSSRRNLLLTWGDWWTRVFLEAGPEVAAASAEIAAVAGQPVPEGPFLADKRIRVLFAGDQSREYTNHAIFMMDFLGTVPGLAVYDPQRQVFL